MIRFLKWAASAVPTPPTGKVVLYVDSTLNQPAYKDETGTVSSLVGPAGPAGPAGPGTDEALVHMQPNNVGMVSGSSSSITAARDFKFIKRTGGDITVSSTTWANLDTGADLVLRAQVGDAIEVGLNTYTASVSASRTVAIDVASLVGGSPVNYWGATGGAGDYGVQSWKVGPNGGGVGGSVIRVLVVGDLSAGTVTLRLRARIDGAGSGTVKSSATEPLQFWAKNLGPVP